MKAVLTLLAVAVMAAVVVGAPVSQPDVVTVASGRVGGIRVASGNYRQWLGVPFAAPATGVNRFAPPAPVTPWSGVFDASEFGHGCWSDQHGPNAARNASEDCLNLNVFAPLNTTTGPSARPLPVVVFFYGGSFAAGGSDADYFMYNASYNAATRDVVYVVANYRLGLFGFMVAEPDLHGNYGIQDQQAALRWVRDNIAAFGGDPSQVTIQGESAGAMSCGIHLVAPASRGLFHRVVMESNPVGLQYNTNKHLTAYGLTACKEMGCATGLLDTSCNVTCAREVPVATVLSALEKASSNVPDFLYANWGHLLDGFLPFKPSVDGTVIPENPIPAMAAGRMHPADVMVGTNTNEAETFLMGGGKPLALEDAQLAIQFVFGKDKGQRVLDYYAPPRYNFTDGRLLFSRALTHFWFRCAGEKFATTAVAAGNSSYVYRYNHVFSDAELFTSFGLPKFCATAVCHATELPLVFHRTAMSTPLGNATMTPPEVALSDRIVSYWTNFAKTGNPNGPGLPEWPLWDATSRPNAVLQVDQEVESSTDLCADLWDQVGYDF